MGINCIRITNYKSLKDIVINNPNPFSVFVGPNAAGKSNVFEAIEFLTSFEKNSIEEVRRKYNGTATIANREWLSNSHVSDHNEIAADSTNNYKNLGDSVLSVVLDLGIVPSPSVAIYKNKYFNELSGDNFSYILRYLGIKNFPGFQENPPKSRQYHAKEFLQCIENFSRIFVKNVDIEKSKYEDDLRLSTSCGNLEKVLKRILQISSVREEFIDWLQLMIPGFESIEIISEPYSKTDSLLIYEKGISKPFTKNLISDGTFNIISLLTAVFQSEEPQFLCIEEPENGLNPKVVQQLVHFFRQQCEEKGHYIWLNTHSQTLVRELTPKEIIIVDKINAQTQIKQIPDMNLHGVKMDEALLSNMIGGGIPW